MRNILIIYPHWPPSNLAGVHRARLLGNFLPEFDWNPIVLTVDEKYYEEQLDQDILKTVSDKITVHKTSAFKTGEKFRLVGDIGLRGFFQLYQKASEIVKASGIDFIYIPIPSYYTAMLGRLLHKAYGIPYGIDYIDPWSGGIPGADKAFSRAWFSNKLANLLEPFAVRKASLISGVSTPYYENVLPWVQSPKLVHVGMPYGFDPNDHNIALENIELPWHDISNCKAIVYAGAFLPKSHLFLKILFKAIASLRELGKWDEDVKLYFLGTGLYQGKSIADYAADYGLENVVYEERERYPFLSILNILARSFGVLVLGSTERHYTASKIFQSLLSKKPILPIFHEESTVIDILKEVEGDQYLVQYCPADKENVFYENLINKLSFFLEATNWCPKLEKLDKYSAKASAKILAQALNSVLNEKASYSSNTPHTI